MTNTIRDFFQSRKQARARVSKLSRALSVAMNGLETGRCDQAMREVHQILAASPPKDSILTHNNTIKGVE